MRKTWIVLCWQLFLVSPVPTIIGSQCRSWDNSKTGFSELVTIPTAVPSCRTLWEAQVKQEDQDQDLSKALYSSQILTFALASSRCQAAPAISNSGPTSDSDSNQPVEKFLLCCGGTGKVLITDIPSRGQCVKIPFGQSYSIRDQKQIILIFSHSPSLHLLP